MIGGVLKRYIGSDTTFHIPSGPLSETDKAIEVAIGFSGELCQRDSIYLPKSQIKLSYDKRSVTVPSWLLKRKLRPGWTILPL